MKSFILINAFSDLFRYLKKQNYRPPYNFLPIILILCISLVILDFAFKKINNNPDVKIIESGKLILGEHEDSMLKKELEQFENCVQYAIVATISGYFDCHKCPFGITKVWLNKGEIWKYGESCQIEKRWPQSKLEPLFLLREDQIKGDIKITKQAEREKLRKYKLLQESRKKEGWFMLPPGNYIYR